MPELTAWPVPPFQVMPVACSPASCSVPLLDVPMAALIGLATARSRGEYTSAFMSLAAVPKGLNSTRSLAVPVAVKLKVSPSICVVARVAMLVNGWSRRLKAAPPARPRRWHQSALRSLTLQTRWAKTGGVREADGAHGGAQCQARHAGVVANRGFAGHAVQRQPQRLLVVQGGADGQRHAAQQVAPFGQIGVVEPEQARDAAAPEHVLVQLNLWRAWAGEEQFARLPAGRERARVATATSVAVVPSTRGWLPPTNRPMVPSSAGICVVCTYWLISRMTCSRWSSRSLGFARCLWRVQSAR